MKATGCRTLALVGFGQFGRFAAERLRDRFEVRVYDTRDVSAEAERLGVEAVSFERAASADVVVLAVPVQALPVTLERLAPLVGAGTLVADVASVKTAPLRWMRERLPQEVEIVGTHPMFGPQSAADGLAGHRIVLCPVRTQRLEQVRAFLAGLGLEVIVTDADTHDRECAYTQALAQWIGRAVAEMPGGQYAVRTPAAELLRRVAALVGEDSWELFAAIQTLNPHARGMRRRLAERLAELQARLTADRLAEPATAQGPCPRQADPSARDS